MCERFARVKDYANTGHGYWLCLSSELCFPVAGGGRGQTHQNLSATAEGEDLRGQVPGDGLALFGYHMDWRCLLLVLPRAGEVGRRWGHSGRHVRAPAVTAGSSSCHFFCCASVSSPVKWVRTLIWVPGSSGFPGSMICAARTK